MKRVHFSNSGLQKKSFALPFHGGAIWFEHLDSLGADEAVFRSKLAADLAEIVKPSAPSHMAVVLDETDVSVSLCALLADVLSAQAHPKKVAFVGMSRREKCWMHAMLRKRGIAYAVSFHSDLEKAKQWLLP